MRARPPSSKLSTFVTWPSTTLPILHRRPSARDPLPSLERSLRHFRTHLYNAPLHASHRLCKCLERLDVGFGECPPPCATLLAERARSRPQSTHDGAPRCDRAASPGALARRRVHGCPGGLVRADALAGLAAPLGRPARAEGGCERGQAGRGSEASGQEGCGRRYGCEASQGQGPSPGYLDAVLKLAGGHEGCRNGREDEAQDDQGAGASASASLTGAEGDQDGRGQGQAQEEGPHQPYVERVVRDLTRKRAALSTARRRALARPTLSSSRSKLRASFPRARPRPTATPRSPLSPRNGRPWARRNVRCVQPFVRSV